MVSAPLTCSNLACFSLSDQYCLKELAGNVNLELLSASESGLGEGLTVTVLLLTLMLCLAPVLSGALRDSQSKPESKFKVMFCDTFYHWVLCYAILLINKCLVAG